MRRWNEWLLAIALVCLGVGVLFGAVIDWAWDAPIAPLVGTVIVGVAMIVPIVLAFLRSRPIGFLRFRPLDLLWGVGLGVFVRLVQGLLSGAEPLPTMATIDGRSSEWWPIEASGAVVVAPVVEELFFRGVLLVTLFTILRRLVGHTAAGIIAALVSTGLFVMLHALAGEAETEQVIGLALLGFTASGVVLLTGRIWGAILLHAVYNTSFVVLVALGTALT